MKKSKEFILVSNFRYGKVLDLYYLNGKLVPTKEGPIQGICHRTFMRFFGIRFKDYERKRVKITIEEIK